MTLTGAFESAARSAESFADALRSVTVDIVTQYLRQAAAAALAKGNIPGAVALATGSGLIQRAGVPALANGGLAYGPTMAMVGDNKNAAIDPEVVAPLSKLKDMMGGGVVEVVGRIKGDDIYLSNARKQQRPQPLRMSSYLFAKGVGGDYYEDSYEVRIIRTAAGSDQTTEFSLAANGFALRYEGVEDSALVPGIVHSRCEVTTLWPAAIDSKLDTLLTGLATSEDGDYLLEVLRDSTRIWVGNILVEEFGVDEDSTNKEVRIVATDALSLLKHVDYNNSGTCLHWVPNSVRYCKEDTGEVGLYTYLSRTAARSIAWRGPRTSTARMTTSWLRRRIQRAPTLKALSARAFTLTRGAT